jgi:hypothetical protein
MPTADLLKDELLHGFKRWFHASRFEHRSRHIQNNTEQLLQDHEMTSQRAVSH